MSADVTFYLVAVPAIILLGLSKGGFVGVGALALPLLALVMPPVEAAAIMLPLLLIQDAVGVWAFRKTWDRSSLVVLLPGAVIGVVLGYLLAARVSEDVVLAVLGAISIVFALYRLWLHARGAQAIAETTKDAPAIIGVLLGVGSGFTSQIAHSGQPPFQIWVMPKRLPRDALVGTTAIYFAIVNWVKVPAYLALGQFTHHNLMISAVLAPIAILSTMAGVKLVRKVSSERYEVIIYWLMILVGAKLIWDAVV
jgi:uncharacterized membrane protein YfcA